MSPPGPWSLTSHLLTTQQPLFRSATQHPFLLAGAEGRLPKPVLSRWLSTDRLYIHSYIRAAGHLLAALDLPTDIPKHQADAPETQLVDWLIDALVGVRREERFFIDVAERYGLGLAPPGVGISSVGGADGETTGLNMIRAVFASIPNSVSVKAEGTTTSPPLLPWLEGALTFWGTERCYLDAWSFARDKARESDSGGGEDADGGALRKEFIPNWSSDEFRRFVERLGGLIDGAVAAVLEGLGEEEAGRVKDGILARVEGPWKTLLEAERAFWPEV